MCIKYYLKYNNMENIAPIIVAIGTIITSILTFFSYSYKKNVDLRNKVALENEKRKNKKRNSDISQIYGELWRVLHELKADRVYIMQPHPLIKNLYVSVSLEVHDNGVEEIRTESQNCRASDYPALVARLAKTEFLYHDDIKQIKDNRSRALCSKHGAEQLFIKKLSDDEHDWIGSIVCEYLDVDNNISVDYAKKILAEAADYIQYILPEYE